MEEEVVVLDAETLTLLEALANKDGVSIEKEAEKLLADFCKQGG